MSQSPIQQSLNLALKHHQAGRLGEAETIYRQILTTVPNHPDALQLLGALAFQTGHHAQALEMIGQAIAVNPGAPHYHCNLGRVLAASGRASEAVDAFNQALFLRSDYPEANAQLGEVLAGAGKLDEAIAKFRLAIQQRPDFADAINSLGNALQVKGQFQEAIASYERAIALRANFPEAFNNLGNALQTCGRLAEAIAAYRQALTLRPQYPEAHNNLGCALRKTGQISQAIAALRQAVALKPNFAEAYADLGNTLHENGQQQEAISAYNQAIALRPDFPEVYGNLGLSLQSRGQTDEAIRVLRHALSLKPDFATAHFNLANALHSKGNHDEAIASYREAIRLQPGFLEAHNNLGNVLKGQGNHQDALAEYRAALSPEYTLAHHNLGLQLLLLGDFAQGWPEYEWRTKLAGYSRGMTQPQWDGNPLEGRRILLYAEQGLGDTIQFVRYIPQVLARGGKVLLQCQPELAGLLEKFDGIDKLLIQGHPLPEYDVQCSLLSLPMQFRTTIDTIPANVPYLRANQEKKDHWRGRLEALGQSRKVGLVWAGGSAHQDDRNRSISLSVLAPPAGVANVQFVSLQKGEPARQASAPPAGMQLIDWSADLRDFSDTAALIDNLDLVITVDTAVAHLAGAMGKSVWVMLPFVPDWRWMLERTDSPWYPTMKLFRQGRLGDWDNVIRELVPAF